MRTLFFLSLGFLFHFSSGNVITLCRECALKEFPDAVNAAQTGDTIIIKPGTYTSINTLIKKPLTIIGENYPVIDGLSKDDVITVLSDHVSLIGIAVRSSNRGSLKDYAGIRVSQSKFVSVLSCHLDNTFFGIYLADSKHVTVKGNRTWGADYGDSDDGNGIHLWKCDSIIVEDNYIDNHRDGIYLEFSKYCFIRNNRCEKNIRYGLHFMFSNDDTYTNNTFNNNGSGVAVMYSHDVHMFSNKFINNWGAAAYGLLLKDITNSIISGNTFSNNTIGINVEGANRIFFEKNDFLKNGYALRIMADCQQDSFKFNNFSGNTFDVGTNGTLNNNFFGFNYWDKYEGYDLNRDKIGDVPYKPVSLFSVIVEKMPFALMLLRSFTVDLLDRAEKNIPSLVPETIEDRTPMMTMNRK